MSDDIISDALTAEQVIDEISKARLAWVAAMEEKDKLGDADKLSIAVITGHLLGIRYAHSRGQKLLTEATRIKRVDKPNRGEPDGDNL